MVSLNATALFLVLSRGVMRLGSRTTRFFRGRIGSPSSSSVCFELEATALSAALVCRAKAGRKGV